MENKKFCDIKKLEEMQLPYKFHKYEFKYNKICRKLDIKINSKKRRRTKIAIKDILNKKNLDYCEVDIDVLIRAFIN